jgi:hypothetical protein
MKFDDLEEEKGEFYLTEGDTYKDRYYRLKDQNEKLLSALKELYLYTPAIGKKETYSPFERAIKEALEAIKSCQP